MNGDPYGIRAAQDALTSAIAARDADIVRTVHAGSTHKVTAELFGVTPARVTQIVTAARDRAWGEPAHAGKAVRVTHESMADAARLAVHAQMLRAEAATGMNATELRSFFGDPDTFVSDVTERRETVAAWRREHTARLAWEREQASEYACRTKRRKTA